MEWGGEGRSYRRTTGEITQRENNVRVKNTGVGWLPWRSDDWGVEQGLTGGEVLIGDIPATRLRGGAGDEEREGLDREQRHLETGGGGRKAKLAR